MYFVDCVTAVGGRLQRLEGQQGGLQGRSFIKRREKKSCSQAAPCPWALHHHCTHLSHLHDGRVIPDPGSPSKRVCYT